MIDEKTRDAVYSRGRVLARTGLKGLWDRVMRKIILIPVKLLTYTPLSGNQITAISVVANIFAGLSFAFGSFWGYVAGMLFLALGELLDWIDGSIARYRNEVTILQADFLGRMYHIMSLSFIFAGLGVGVYNNTHNVMYLFLGMSCGLLQQTTVYILELKNSLLLNYKKFASLDDIKMKFIPEKRDKKLIKYFGLPIDYLYIKPIILCFILFNILDYFLMLYTIYFLLRLLLFTIGSYYNLKRVENTESNQ